ncbi:hypothetical protein THAR02_05598 [Trichoderma harzianum]|uniref:NAD-dependent epimerase/dehydratase domain-containing protein n=1 Tax=Trichoderma harzianum TaxID=5544 RepID=A0A0F9XCL1_TRIHA|nr:hypothetical protein THAR02_05598 [Trichoderma harzianum]
MADSITNFPQGSWVLVTDVTGFVASHIAKAFLDRGFKVRGTARNLDRASWLTKDVLKDFATRGDFELSQVADLADDHTFDEAIKGVSAIVHVVSILTFDPDPNKVIPKTVAGATSILKAATREQSDTYNDFATQGAWAPPPYEPSRGMLTYMASKAAAEKAVWQFAEERKPHFTANSVPPSAIMGEALNKVHNEGTGA